MNTTRSQQITGPQTEIADTDIIFECPHCAKSMAIDRRGGGLMISCPDCGTRIRVPEPEPLELAPESTVNELIASTDPHVRNLAQSLDHSREKVQQLMARLEEARKRRGALEKLRISDAGRLGKISEEIAVIQSSIDRIAGLLQDAMADHADDGSEW